MLKDKYGKTLTGAEMQTKVFNRIHNYWLDFLLLILAWIALVPSHTVRLFFFGMAGVKIGKGSRIHVGCRFFNPHGVVIGEDSIIGNNAFLDGRARLSIGSHVTVSSDVLIYNSQHDIDSDDFHAVELPVEIEDYVYIGPRSIILPGVKIGYGAVVAAGAVVSHDIASRDVVGGVPARIIRQRKGEKYTYLLGRARLFQ